MDFAIISRNGNLNSGEKLDLNLTRFQPFLYESLSQLCKRHMQLQADDLLETHASVRHTTKLSNFSRNSTLSNIHLMPLTEH